MPIRTADEYIASLRNRPLRVYLFGELVEEPVDLAGGLMVTLPSARDFASEVTGPLLNKYLKGRPGVSVDNRRRVLRLIENMTMGRNAVGYLTESQRVQIARLMQLDEKKALAAELAGIEASDDEQS
jgi:4-hydroxybutyryl-CoA dehydratase/vinylacetyl-CoA-Delta-isomerase